MLRQKKEPIAHVRKSDQATQPLSDHLRDVAAWASEFAAKIGLGRCGELIGLAHDIGKGPPPFQNYLLSASNLLDQDADEYVNAANLKGKIDHSTAGAQLLWSELAKYQAVGRLCGQILSLCACSHHSGLIDCLAPDGAQTFIRRMNKPEEEARFQESLRLLDPDLQDRIRRLCSKELLSEMKQFFEALVKHETGKVEAAHPNSPCRTCPISCRIRNPLTQFKFGLLARFLLSCLLDADRIDSASFEDNYRTVPGRDGPPDWQPLVDRLEHHLAEMVPCDHIDKLRHEISKRCRDRAADARGIFTLTVPTGGGKTLAGLRFALHHAQKHNLDRIIHVVPYTSIIDQNAQVARDVLERGDEPGSVVLEHHSNIEPEKETWRSKLLAENWDAPVIYTTMVQFLESLFGGGTRGARRMHRLARAVLVFDEIQTLPLPCVHLFCNALNFLVDECGASAVLCTATQPLLGELKHRHKGYLSLGPEREIMPNVARLFAELKRVEVIDQTRPQGWSAEEIADLAIGECGRTGSCLVVVNTKDWARKIHAACASRNVTGLYHLSTNMCPAHRLAHLNDIRARLGREPVLCVSTQLIEAGVDVDFGAVVRFVAGMDSVIQAAGRCNRNAKQRLGRVHLVNPDRENVDPLPEIKSGQEVTLRLLDEFKRQPASLGGDLLDPRVIERYFEYYFFKHSDKMDYPVSPPAAERRDNLLHMLSCNPKNPGDMNFQPALRQSFAAAAAAFRVIDAPTEGVIVPHEAGKEIITQLCASFDPPKQRNLLRQAQRYMVNVFPYVMRKLREEHAIQEIQRGCGIFYLVNEYYNPKFGLSTTATGNPESLYVGQSGG